MMDALSEIDDRLMEFVLNDQNPPVELIKEVMRNGLKARQLFPVLSGSALKNIGVQPMLDHVAEIFPSPASIEGSEAKALLFKIQKLPNIGLLYYLKIYSGNLLKGDRLYNLTLGKRFRINRIVRMHAISLEDLETAGAGDIVGVIGLEGGRTGDTLASNLRSEKLFPIEVPDSVISVAVFPESKSNSDIEKMNSALRFLTLQDPSLKILEQADQQKVISGMGELHLQVAVATLEEICNFKILTSSPKVEYRSTFKSSRDITYTYKKQSGGSGLWAKVMIRFEPIDSGEIIFEDQISGEGISTELRPSVEDGIRYESSVGIGRYPPLTGFKAVLYDGETHPVDSNKRAFEMAGRFALREASEMNLKSNLKILEPIMSLKIITVDEFIGRISGDINNKRGSIIEIVKEESEHSSKVKVYIDAEAPLGELFNYINFLRSITSGEVSVNYTFSRYGNLPVHLEEKVFDKIE